MEIVTEPNGIPWSVIATFTVAAVALIASLVAYISSRAAQKIAKQNLSMTADLEIIRFREKWIQNLRNEIAEFTALSAAKKFQRPDGNFDREEYAKIHKHSTKIQLLMNPNDEDFENLRHALANEVGVLTDEEKQKFGDKIILIPLCQKILKREWDRLKSDLKKYEKQK